MENPKIVVIVMSDHPYSRGLFARVQGELLPPANP